MNSLHCRTIYDSLTMNVDDFAILFATCIAIWLPKFALALARQNCVFI